MHVRYQALSPDGYHTPSHSHRVADNEDCFEMSEMDRNIYIVVTRDSEPGLKERGLIKRNGVYRFP